LIHHQNDFSRSTKILEVELFIDPINNRPLIDFGKTSRKPCIKIDRDLLRPSVILISLKIIDEDKPID